MTSKKLLWALSLLELAVVAATAGVLWGLGDRWWVATVLLFAPRWIYGAPLLLLVPAALWVDRRALAPLFLAAAVLLVPVIGFRVPGLHRLKQAALGGSSVDLRVMTYNVGGGDVPTDALLQLITEVRADVVALEERNDPIAAPGFQSHCDASLCLLSRFPIRTIEARDRREFWPDYGCGAIILYGLETPLGLVHVQQVHLATVRHGLKPVMRGRPWLGAPELIANTALRDRESRAAAAWTQRATGPLLVMGDFNLPVESAIYRRHWGAFTNAFSEAGFGFGASKRTRWHGIRIDHVLANPDWEVEQAWVGPGLGGDHRPMIVELHLANRR